MEKVSIALFDYFSKALAPLFALPSQSGALRLWYSNAVDVCGLQIESRKLLSVVAMLSNHYCYLNHSFVHATGGYLCLTGYSYGPRGVRYYPQSLLHA